MKVIFINEGHGGSRTLWLGRWSRALLSVCFLGLPLSLIGLGYYLAHAAQPSARDISMGSLQDELDAQNRAVTDLRADALRKLQALSLSVAELEARLLRLDAMGHRLTDMAGLDQGEFDFDSDPALGGPLTGAGEAANSTELSLEMESLEARIADREQQLEVLQALLHNRQIAEDLYLSGRPIRKGWMSSTFGKRKDPFTGATAWHEGVDFAGKSGSDIIAVASGVVTWSGERHGYGQMVEISHGGGYTTRYTHNKDNLVKMGDLVRKGQVIALMGSSGRSTGPHVHYEVYKHGRAVDPASYIARTRR